MAFSAVPVAVIVLSPAIRRQFGLSLGQIGLLVACVPMGGSVTALIWGHLTDRVGERIVMTSGLATSALLLALAQGASSFAVLSAILVACGAAGSSVSAAGGRAIMGWFGPDERGFALAVRQSAVPVGGFFSALAFADQRVTRAFVVLAILSGAGALIAAALIREQATRQDRRPPSMLATVRQVRLLRLAAASALLSTGQVCIAGFAVVFLTDNASLDPAAAGSAFAAIQLISAILRIAVGHWSDRRGKRVRLMYEIAMALVTMSLLIALVTHASPEVLLPAIVVIGATSLAWNGLSFTATAELAGRDATGTAVGLQQAALGGWAFAAAPAFGTLVSASSWSVGFMVVACAIGASAVLLRSMPELAA